MEVPKGLVTNESKEDEQISVKLISVRKQICT